MKAVVFDKFGDANVLQVADVPKPVPKPDEVIVHIRACALNRLDIYLRAEPDATVQPMPHILGSDVSGEIAQLGPAVSEWKVGDEVIVCPSMTCGICAKCVTGEDTLCPSFGILGWQTQGGYAEYVAVPARNLIKKPKNVSHEEGAALPLVLTTSWHMLVTRGQLKAKETVLVMGGSSGIGTILIQLAKAKGARVIATVGDMNKAERLRQLGADTVVNHTESEWDHRIKQIAPEGVAIVCEHLGGEYFEKCISLLAKGGRLVTIGRITGDQFNANISTLYGKQIALIGSYMGTKRELEQTLELVEKGAIKPIVDKVFALEKAQDAHKYLEERKNFGKVILKVS